jgi:hypothetical protein
LGTCLQNEFCFSISILKISDFTSEALFYLLLNENALVCL